MITIQQRCDLALGQMAKNKRLNRTIPHKAFEFAYLAKPYLSGRNLAIKELFVENVEILCFEPGNPKDLAEKIKSILDDDIYRLELARNFQRAYFEKCSQYSLSKKFLDLANEQLD
jgi:glycosyltransferase involved in cell wall biosynthesis